MSVCVTNDMSGRACVILGEHLSACVGGTCEGCLPRPAKVGMLCELCDRKWRDALDVVSELVAFLLSGGVGPVDVNRSRGMPGPRLPIGSGRLVADEVVKSLAGVVVAWCRESGESEPVWPVGVSMFDGFMPSLTLSEALEGLSHLVGYVDSQTGLTGRRGAAEGAVRFTREVQRGLKAFPLVESPSRVPYLRCRSCRKFTVLDMPPLMFLGDRVLVCSSCGVEADVSMKEFDLAVYRSELELARKVQENT